MNRNTQCGTQRGCKSKHHIASYAAVCAPPVRLPVGGNGCAAPHRMEATLDGLFCNTVHERSACQATRSSQQAH